MNVIIDTCVILDVLQNREPFVTNAISLFDILLPKLLPTFLSVLLERKWLI